jgi:hypothetical protein
VRIGLENGLVLPDGRTVPNNCRTHHQRHAVARSRSVAATTAPVTPGVAEAPDPDVGLPDVTMRTTMTLALRRSNQLISRSGGRDPDDRFRRPGDVRGAIALATEGASGGAKWRKRAAPLRLKDQAARRLAGGSFAGRAEERRARRRRSAIRPFHKSEVGVTRPSFNGGISHARSLRRASADGELAIRCAVASCRSISRSGSVVRRTHRACRSSRPPQVPAPSFSAGGCFALDVRFVWPAIV